MGHTHGHGTKEEQEEARKKEMKVGLTNDKATIGGVAGVGAGAAAGAAIGSVVPGVGTAFGAVVGGTIGAVTGALGGAAIGSAIDAREEEAYWRKHYSVRPYAKDVDWNVLEPAYRYGWEARARHAPTTTWDEVEPELGRDWAHARGGSRLEWPQARDATRDAWERISTTVKLER